MRGRHDRPIPILMYHVLSAPPPGVPYPQLYVSPRDFKGEMGWLAAHGFHAVTLSRVHDYWASGYALPRRPVVITFDDGYLSVDTVALPSLRALGWPGVVNLSLAHLQSDEGLRPWRVRELIAAGWEVDSHTLTHPDLTRVGREQLHREVLGSRRALQRRFGVPAAFFSYPSGRFDSRVVTEVEAAGYLGATTTLDGLATPRHPSGSRGSGSTRATAPRASRTSCADSRGRRLPASIGSAASAAEADRANPRLPRRHLHGADLRTRA